MKIVALFLVSFLIMSMNSPSRKEVQIEHPFGQSINFTEDLPEWSNKFFICVHVYSKSKKKQQAKKKLDRKSQILVGFGIVSILVLLLVGFGAGLKLIELSGFLLFSVATAIGFLLSKRKNGNKKNNFIKALFILAIVANLIGSASMLLLKGLF